MCGKLNLPRFVLHGTLGSYVKHGVDKQEAALLRGDMPDQPHWGEETEEEWGLYIQRLVEKRSAGNIRVFLGITVGFIRTYMNTFAFGEALQTGARDILNVIRVIEATYQTSRKVKLSA